MDGNLLTAETSTYFYHTDHLGSTVLVTNEKAEIVWSSEYTPFGSITLEEGEYGFQKAKKFTGKDLDEDTGLYYYNARWYDAEIGRFTSADTYKGELVNPQTLNVYIYTMNNPLIYVDPSGNSTIDFSNIIETYNYMQNKSKVSNEMAYNYYSDAYSDGLNNVVENIDFRHIAGMATIKYYQFGAKYWGGVAKVGETADKVGQWTKRNAGIISMIPAFGFGFNMGQGIDKVGFKSDYYIEDKDDVYDWGVRTLVSVVSTQNFLNGIAAFGISGQDSLGDVWIKSKALVQASLPGGNGGVLDSANFAQKTYNPTFSKEGIKIYSDLAGKPINTVDDLTNALKSGAIKVSDVSIDYIVRDGNTILLNTRSSQALTQAGIPRGQWNTVNQTGNSFYEDMLTNQLSRNGLTSSGTSIVRMSGGVK